MYYQIRLQYCQYYGIFCLWRLPDIQPEHKTLFKALWRVLFQVGGKHDQVAIS